MNFEVNVAEEKNADMFSNEIFFTLEGKITEVQIAASTINLLRKIEKNIEEKNLAGGVAAAINGMPGTLATSAMLSLYDGEDMHNFAGLVNGEVVCGVFADADKIKDGDFVRLVVARRGDVLHVHSLLRIEDSLLLMPLNAYCGERAFFWSCMRFARNMTLFVWIVLFSGFFLFIDVSQERKEDLITACGAILLMPPLFCFPFEYWTYKTMRDYSIYAEKIFVAYGFPRPDVFDARGGITFFENNGNGFFSTNCELALKKHKSKYKI
ncbi:MAG: hypothetical protein ACOH2S_06215 [Janthinobacterium svalbardensis]